MSSLIFSRYWGTHPTMRAPLSLLDHLLRYLSPSTSQWSFRIRCKNFGEIKTFSPWYHLLPVYLKLNFSFGTLSIPWSIWFIALTTLFYDTVLIVLSVHLNYIISPMRAGTYLLLFFPHVPKSWSEPQEKLSTYLLKQYHLYANPLIFQFYFLYFQS